MKWHTPTARIITTALLAGACGTASAEIISGISLDAQSIKDSFDSLNGNTGIHFILTSNDIANDPKAGYAFADIAAYGPYHAGIYPNPSFWTFCVEPGQKAFAYTSTAQLGYSNGMSATTSGAALTVGAAYLYSMAASDRMLVTSNADISALQSATRFLMGDMYDIERGTNWNSNAYLKNLLSINDANYWTSVYDPDAYYSEIGNYSVFVMNVTAFDGTPAQDFLYFANAASPYTPPPVPEPETWAMMLAGLAMAGVIARRRHPAR
ncbi:MAG: PEPxxWA-CTERM sorting domain-containing protein [Azoarcus sp.]|jgi:hypothetical protein|nr:PEPxxWA-CTERM sorting domain-containing protein [Azoarcus sp.]